MLIVLRQKSVRSADFTTTENLKNMQKQYEVNFAKMKYAFVHFLGCKHLVSSIWIRFIQE